MLQSSTSKWDTWAAHFLAGCHPDSISCMCSQTGNGGVMLLSQLGLQQWRGSRRCLHCHPTLPSQHIPVHLLLQDQAASSGRGVVHGPSHSIDGLGFWHQMLVRMCVCVCVWVCLQHVCCWAWCFHPFPFMCPCINDAFTCQTI